MKIEDLTHKYKLKKEEKTEDKIKKGPKHKEKSIHKRPDILEKNEAILYGPYSSWQKGMNENCNGILRRFIPKRTDLSTISKYKLKIILEKITGKPREILNYTSAEDMFNIEINKMDKLSILYIFLLKTLVFL